MDDERGAAESFEQERMGVMVPYLVKGSISRYLKGADGRTSFSTRFDDIRIVMGDDETDAGYKYQAWWKRQDGANFEYRVVTEEVQETVL